MERLVSLRGLKTGESAMITELLAQGAMYARLLDLGFTCGSRVCCLFSSALGNPRAYWVRGTVIALRHADAELVLCEAQPGEPEGEA